jgi:hypothetical protein
MRKKLESRRGREVIQMYADWVKRMSLSFLYWYEINVTKKKANDVQKEISAKNKVWMHDQLLTGFGSR